MSLVAILIAALFVVILYKIVVWLLAKLKVNIDNEILVIGALILFLLIVLGRVSLGL